MPAVGITSTVGEGKSLELIEASANTERLEENCQVFAYPLEEL